MRLRITESTLPGRHWLTFVDASDELSAEGALSPFCLALRAAILARRIGWPRFIAVSVPFAIPVVLLCSLLHSTLKLLWRGGIRWRDTFHPLETLRAGGVR